MTKQQWHTVFTKTHKWVGLVLGIQLLFWTLGGIVMTWIPIETVRGTHKVSEAAPAPIRAADDFLAVADIVSLSPKPVVEARYSLLLGQPVVNLRHGDDTLSMRSATSGTLLSPIPAALAERVAVADFNLDVPVLSVLEINTPSVDYRGQLPVWQVRFDDAENTALYVSQSDGRVVARRSTIWRIFDFFWMLHIMDYSERTDINNWLIIATSFFAALFTISGFGLLFFRFYRRDFNFLLGRKTNS